MDYSSEAKKQQMDSPAEQERHELVVKVTNLDVNQTIDFSASIRKLNGQRKLLINMIKRLEDESLSHCMQMVTNGLNAKNWGLVKQGAHMLKGATGYVGAGRVHYACYQIQRAYNRGDFRKMESYYPLLLEYSIELKRFMRRYLTDLTSK